MNIDDLTDEQLASLYERCCSANPDFADLVRVAGMQFGDPTVEDTAWLLQQMGVYDNDDIDDESVIDKYASNLRNYLYTYKDSATAIDPSIDPQQQQIGIMAQDLEKVNPACVQETPQGVKTVDTARLALMNAGAIADLAREVQELKHGR